MSPSGRWRDTERFVRDIDGRRLEVVADGLPLPCRLAATSDGAVCVDARRRKERVGGRWSTESLAFVNFLARAKARGDPHHAQTCGTSLAVEVVVALGVRCWLGPLFPTQRKSCLDCDGAQAQEFKSSRRGWGRPHTCDSVEPNNVERPFLLGRL